MNSSSKQNEFNKELRKIAIPLALQQLLTSLVGASDALMLGRLNQESIAAVSLANQVTFVLSLFTMALVGSVSTLISQYYGKKDLKNTRRFFAMSIRYTFLVSFLFFLLTMLIPDRLMAIYTSTPQLIEIGASYLRIVGVSYLFTGLSLSYMAVMKIAGRARLTVLISLVAVIVDMSMDFFLIYGFGPIPALGANGSAYSTVLVEAVVMIFCLADSYRKDHIHPGIDSMFYFSREFEGDLWKIAGPMFASSMTWGVGFSMRSLVMGHLGTDATAAYSVSSVVMSLLQCIGHGIANGSVIMIGALLGKNELEKAKDYGHRFCNVAWLVAFVNVALTGLVGPIALRFFVLEPAAQEYLIRMLAITAVYLFAFSFNTIVTSGVFIAGGDAMFDAKCVTIASWCMAIPLSLLGTFVFHWPVMVIYLIICLDEILKAPFIYPHYRKYVWLKNLTRETEEQQ